MAEVVEVERFSKLNQSYQINFLSPSFVNALPVRTSMLIVPPGLSSVRLMCFLLCGV